MPVDFNIQFEEAIKGLNLAQKEAVDAIEGPVMVVAGPGTGKTQILAARIGNILKQTDAAPENILCMTFTDAGTIAMRKRLHAFIGPDAYRVGIHTFHSFSNAVIQDHSELFSKGSLDPITDLERIELMQEMIEQMPEDNPLKRWRGSLYHDMKNLSGLFEQIKRENWEVDWLIERIDEHLKEEREDEKYIYKVNGKTFKKGDFKQKDWDAYAGKIERFRGGVLLFQAYEDLMRTRGLYDFADMIRWVVRAFSEDEDLLREYQERYHYFLIDEYQDTNGAQNELIQLLGSYFPNPNIFVVGDDDQSIYRFQGANLDNILQFNRNYGESVRQVVLLQNYRSAQGILTPATSFIDRNLNRLVGGDKKALKASNPLVMELPVHPRSIACYNQAHEDVYVANEILRLRSEGVPLAEIAVIYREHKQAERLSRYLLSKGIKLFIKKDTNVLEVACVAQLVNILRYLAEENRLPGSGEARIFEILHYRCFGLKALDIAKAAVAIRKENRGRALLQWRDILSKRTGKGQQDLFEKDEIEESVREVVSRLEAWIESIHNKTLHELIEMVCLNSGLLGQILRSEDKMIDLQALQTFYRFMEQESLRKSKMSLPDLIELLDMMENHELELNIQRSLYHEDGVNFLSVHGSKGLEFSHVFIIGMQSDKWERKSSRGGFKQPPNLYERISETAQDLEELRRLFYVAMTRAKVGLSISWSERNTDGKEFEQSRLLVELEENADISCEQVHLSDEGMLEYLQINLMPLERPSPKLIEDEKLREFLKDYSLSVTHLNRYLKCPVSFYFEQILRIPEAKSPNMAFGSAVHHALEQLFIKYQDTKELPAVSDLLQDFEWYMHRHRDAFTDKELKHKLSYGQRILQAYYENYSGSWTAEVELEKAFRNIAHGEFVLNGKIDRMDKNGDKWVLIDYKTGNYANHKKYKKFQRPAQQFKDPEAPSFEEQYGGDYWRQAVFYNILLSSDPMNSKALDRFVFDYIEPDEKDARFFQEEIVIGEQDVAQLNEQIEAAYKGITNMAFDKGCGEDHCRWCRFVDSNYTHLEPVEPGDEPISG